jgi:hypothetical protein
MRTIALEEHFWTAELAAPPGTGQLAVWGPRIGDELSDLGDLRLAEYPAGEPRRQGEDRGRQRRPRAGPQACLGTSSPSSVIYVTSALPKVCATGLIYGTMML